jgi:tetratricopeptide (TPR) repeat protein
MLLPILVLSIIGTAPPGPASIAFERAEQDLADNRLDEAETSYRQAIAARPNYAEAINGLGSVLFKQGKKDEAIAQFKAAIDADPSFKLAYFNLGYAARKSNDFATAARAYERYVQLEPDDPDGLYGLGESYRQLGERAKAIGAYEQFIAKETRPSEEKWIDKAKEYITALRPSPAEPRTISGKSPTFANPFVAAGLVKAADEAPVASTSGQAPLAAHQIAEGDRLMEEQKYRSASFSYEDAVRSDANNIEALFKLGNALGVLGYYTQAIVNWSKAAQLTNDAAVHKTAAENVARARQKMSEVTALPLSQTGVPSALNPLDPTLEQQKADKLR